MKRNLIYLGVVLSLTSCGGGGGSSVSTPSAPSPSTTNTPPMVDIQPTISLYEGGKSVLNIDTSDPDGDQLSFSLSGADASLFEINTNRDLLFKSLPNFELPDDSDADNTYQLVVSVSDGDLSVSQSLDVEVLDAFEGRVVDGPIEDSLVFVDLNGNGVFDENEPQAQSDSNGFFVFREEITTGLEPLAVIAKGGVDSFTGESLDNLSLFSKLPSSVSSEIAVNPLSTILTGLSDSTTQAELLSLMNINLSPDEVFKIDLWDQAEKQDVAAIQQQKKAYQLAVVLLSVKKLNLEQDVEVVEVKSIIASVAESLLLTGRSQGQISLANVQEISTVLSSYAASNPASNLSQEKIATLAASIANTNALIESAIDDPTAENTSAFVGAIQSTYIEIVADFANEVLSAEQFNEQVNPERLFSSLLPGSSGGDQLVGGDDNEQIDAETGNDVITTGSGDDDVYAGSGNDSITVDSTGSKIIDGGPDNDLLTINYSGISSLDDFSLSFSDGYIVFDDGNGTEVNVKNIESLSVGSRDYLVIYNGAASGVSTTLNRVGNYYDPTEWSIGGEFTQLNFGNNVISSAFYDQASQEVYVFPFGANQGGHLTVNSLTNFGYNGTSGLSIKGTSANDLIAGGSGSATLTIKTEDGVDVIDVHQRSGADSVDAGAGDDTVYVNTSFASDAAVAGGLGEDWLVIMSASGDSISYTLNTSTTSGFENVAGRTGSDTLTGDENANVIMGYSGSDVLSGAGGNDTLYGYLNALPSVPINAADEIDGADTLYGGAGNDALYGGAGDDTLDGGVGRDVLVGDGASGEIGGTNGSDTFVTRGGDGGSTIATADVIMDFDDGTDQIALEGMTFNDLTLEQGSGDYVNDTVVKYGSEFLFVIKDVSVSAINYLDIVSTSTEPQILSGTNDDDILVGGSGNDTISSGAGEDTIISFAGNDSISIDGIGSKTIDGGPGDDSLTITYSGVTSLADFTLELSDEYLSLDDGASTEILFKNIESLNVGINDYVMIYNGNASGVASTLNTTANYYDPVDWSIGGEFTQLNFGNNIVSSAFYDQVNQEVYLYPFGAGQGSHVSLNSLSTFGYNGSSALRVKGTSSNDLIAAGSGSAALNINTADGVDVIDIHQRTGMDSVDAGAGDDIVYVGIDFVTDTVLDGGAGNDWLVIMSASSDSVSYILNSSITSGFENIAGRTGADTLTGDAAANILMGYAGADVLTGGEGNDTLYGYLDALPGVPMSSANEVDGADILTGGAGDDSLYGGAGDDTLDGGTGRDVLVGDGTSGAIGGNNGVDTFVTRAGDGGTSLATADVIMDFEDGKDLIGLDGLAFGDLTIEAGTGDYANDTVVKYGSEYLMVIKAVSASDITYLDVVSTSTDPLVITGTDADDTLIGGSGNDTISSGAGVDTILGYAGNDAITLNGAGNKVVDGGQDSDSLTINYTGVSSLADFTLAVSDDYLSLNDGNSSEIQFKNIESLTVGSNNYVMIYKGVSPGVSGTANSSGNYYDPVDWSIGGEFTQLNFGNDVISSAYYDQVNGEVYLYPFAEGQGSHVTINSLQTFGYSGGGPLSVSGTDGNDLVATGSGLAPLTIDAGDGVDVIDISQRIGVDTIDAGSGNDIVYVGTDYANDSSIAGGLGSDWLVIMSASGDSLTFTLNTSVTSGFENLSGWTGSDSLTGDASSNILMGYAGSDILSGGDGNDTLYGYLSAAPNVPISGVNEVDDADVLIGGAGDDALYGGAGDDTLEGGTGRDMLVGDGISGAIGGLSGVDTFITRAGDGGDSVATADVIMDFEDEVDQIGLVNINFADLTIEQGSGDYASDAIVKLNAEVLLVVKNIDAAALTTIDFTPVAP